MAFEDFLNHTCDIYHVVEKNSSPGYNLPSSKSFYYNDAPDIYDQPCHFGTRSSNISIVQTVPANLMNARIKLTLPLDADIKLNDKIVDCETKLEYTAEQPIKVQNHHIFVYIKRKQEQEPL